MTKNARGGDMGYYEHRTQGSTVLNDAFYDSHDRYSNEKQLAQLTADYSFRINERGDKFTLNGRLRYDWYALEYTESNMLTPQASATKGLAATKRNTTGISTEVRPTNSTTVPTGNWNSATSTPHTANTATTTSPTGTATDRSSRVAGGSLCPVLLPPTDPFVLCHADRPIGPVSFDAGLRADNTLDELQIAVANANPEHLASGAFPFRTHRLRSPPRPDDLRRLCLPYQPTGHLATGNPTSPTKTTTPNRSAIPTSAPSTSTPPKSDTAKQFSGDNSLAFTGFFRSRRGVIDRVRVAYEPGVTLDSLINAGNDRSGGLEIAARIKAARWWQMSLNGSLFGYKFTSRYEGCEDASNLSYAIGMINNFTLGATTRMQFDANVVGPTVLTQGREEAYCYFDMAIRQQICKNRISAAVVIHDLFHTALYRNRRATSTLLSTTRVRPKYPNIVLSLSYSFNAATQRAIGTRLIRSHVRRQGFLMS